MASGKLIILGCGSSAGVPAIGNWWGACDPNDKRNLRTRPSVALQTDQTMIIVDTGPDFREQMNRENLGCPDAVIFTHVHSDHVNGIDELRALMRRHKRGKFPTYSDEATISKMLHRFDYMFATMENGFYPAVCEPIVLEMGREVTVGDIAFTPFLQDHGTMDSIGIRLGNIAYSTDVKRLDEKAYSILEGINTWIVDGAAYHEPTNPVHANLAEVYTMNERVKARRVILTHLPPTMDYQKLIDELPKGYEPATDGMVLEF